MRLRSLLYVPASAPRFIAKAHERGADAIILDLEDAVVEDQKDAARAALAEAVPQVCRGGAGVFVRVNAGRRLAEDARAAVAAGAAGIMLPKVRRPAEIDVLAAVVGATAVEVIAIVEDAVGLLAAHEIARHPAVAALCLGSEDFATETRAEPTAEVLRLPKLLLHYAAKAEGKRSLGLLRSVADYADLDSLAAAAAEARRFGFDGATCIHPSAVAVLNEAFSPSRDEVARARRIVEAAAQAAGDGTGAFLLDGEFVDLPVVTRARMVLDQAGDQ
ncbi:MAG: CoA ester lyase [Kiloniellaceae bacterium]